MVHFYILCKNCYEIWYILTLLQYPHQVQIQSLERVGGCTMLKEGVHIPQKLKGKRNKSSNIVAVQYQKYISLILSYTAS